MAKMDVKTGAEYSVRLSELAGGSRKIAEQAIYKAAGIVADRIRVNLENNLKDPSSAAKNPQITFKKMGRGPTGDLLNSLGISPITVDRTGYINAKIGFDGYDRRGVPNPLKARVMESGSSIMQPRPFVRPAVKATKKAAEEAMKQVIDEETHKIMKG